MTIPNVGPATARDFADLNIITLADLHAADPYDLYEKLCAIKNTRIDPCQIDVFIAATQFAKTGHCEKWWLYTPLRKAELARRAINQ